MLAEFDLDRVIEYGFEQENQEKKVANPEYRRLTQKLKKVREKKNRLKAKLHTALEKHLDQNVEKITKVLDKHAETTEKIQQLDLQIDGLIKQRNQHPSKITVKDMPEEKRYNRLKKESKLLANIIKMILKEARPN